MCACVLFYNTKLWTQFYISGLTWEQGWLRFVCASLQYDQTLPFFRISSEMGVHTYDTHDTHWLTENTKKKKKKYPATSCGGYYNAEISLHKAIPFSIQHLYCLKYKTYHFSNKTFFFIPKPVVLFVNERII